MTTNWDDDYEMPAEYDLKKLTRVLNPFTQQFLDLNLVALGDDSKAIFLDSEAVHAALRLLMKSGNGAHQQSTEFAKAS